MKKVLFITPFLLFIPALVLAEKGVLTNPIPMCQKRGTAASAAMITVEAISQGAERSVIDNGLEQFGCLYLDKGPARVKVHKKTKDMRNGQLWHYAQISVLKMGSTVMSDEIQNVKWWIAAPFVDDGKVNIIKLDSGKYW